MVSLNNLNPYNRVITTGSVQPDYQKPKTQVKEEPEVDFNAILMDKIKANSSIDFSKHAVNRVVERNIDLSPSNLERLNNGVELARAKGLNEPLILVDRTAFIVNVNNNKVITTISEENLKNNVITNIDGTVIV